MGAVERLGGKKSDVVRVKIFLVVSVFPLKHFAGQLKATYTVLIAGITG